MAMLGRYDLLETLGQGGFATVYRAHDPLLDRDVAIKVLLPQLGGDAGIRQRFLSEARAIARLSHPNIATVFDVGEVAVDAVLQPGAPLQSTPEPQPFYAMELIHGRTLSEVIRTGGAQPLAWVLEVL